jgi:hypothetical protein
MKRLAWLLVALYCTAFVRVQPFELVPCCHCACCHCKVPGTCGMPCGRAQAPAPLMFAAGQAARVSQPALRRNELPARVSEKRFYASFVEPAAASVALGAAAAMAPSAGVPLFKAHCSFLI